MFRCNRSGFPILHQETPDNRFHCKEVSKEFHILLKETLEYLFNSKTVARECLILRRATLVQTFSSLMKRAGCPIRPKGLCREKTFSTFFIGKQQIRKWERPLTKEDLPCKCKTTSQSRVEAEVDLVIGSALHVTTSTSLPENSAKSVHNLHRVRSALV